MNKQEVFEKVAKHLLKQNAKARAIVHDTDPDAIYNDIPGCAYRGDNGTKCAVGCLIPDELYKPDFENISVRWLGHNTNNDNEKSLRETLELLDLADFAFLGDLQDIHDGKPVDQWRDSLVAFCVKHDLDGEFLLTPLTESV